MRGIAVVAVLFFHAGFSWAKGGWLGVSVFFTLSGFLITSLLLRDWEKHGRILFGTFYSRRARRLLPAALVTLAADSLLAPALASTSQLRHLRADVLGSVGYVANWRFLFSHTSYADLFSAPSPVQHFWSLAIEEQFYLVYPLVAYLALRLGGRRLLGAVLVTGTIGSVVWSLHLHAALDRVYYGTDTRAAELLVGGLLALSWFGLVPARERLVTAGRQHGQWGQWGQWGVAMVGFAGLIGTLVLCDTMAETSSWVTHGLLPLQALLSAAMIAAAARTGLVARTLSWRPLAAIGLVSYGLYLYHWPVYLALSPQRTHLSQVPLFFLRVAVTGLLAWGSYRLIEQPVRRRRVLTGQLALPTAIGAAACVAVVATAVTVQIPRTNLAYANVTVGRSVARVTHLAPPPAAPAPSPGVRDPATTVDPPAAAPTSIMIIGDSGMFDASPGIQALYQRLGTTTVLDTAFPGFGLTSVPAWRTTWPALVAANRPQLIVAMLGGWDMSYVKAHGVAAYEAVLDDATKVVTAAGGHILWLGMPPNDCCGQRSEVDAIMQATARQHPGVAAYADPAKVLDAPDGNSPRWLADAWGRLVLARKPDRWHFCPDGSVLIARLVASRAAALGWSPPPQPGWEQGSWRAQARYNDPAGGCNTGLAENAPPGGS